jgi:nitrous oxidase accessory protein
MISRIAFILALFFAFSNASALQEAIDNAEAGSIIKLGPGIYKGRLTITKPITIVGTAKGVVIDGEGEGSVINIKSSYVTLKNLTITNSGSRHENLDCAISINDASQCEVSDCTITDCLFGIDMQMTNNSIIQNNYITSKDFDLGLRGDGLRLWYSNDNLIKGNRLIKSRDMVVWYSHGNTIEENHGEYCRYSLHFMYAGKNYVRNNSYKYNSVGIFFMYSQDTIATGNIVKSSLGATGMGIGLKDVSNFTIKDNTLIYNAQGMYIDRSPFEPDTNNFIEGNKILYNAEALHFHSLSENNIIKNNTLLGNIEDIVNDSRGSKTDENDFEGNYWDSYTGFDRDNDNIGDTPHRVYQYADKLWLYNPEVKFFYGSPVISLLNFLAKLAPFSEPVFLLEDAKPRLREKG